MATSFSSPLSAALYARAVELAVAGRVFTLRQLARHPEVSWRSQPEKRAREFLAPYRDCFEVIPWLRTKPYLWRLTDKEKRRRGLKYRNVGATAHTEHWLAIGDSWCELVENGLRPRIWFTEGKDIGRFDVFTMIQNKPFMMEIQLSDLSSKEWKEKWRRRIHWMQQKRWKEDEWSKRFCGEPPKVILVTSHKMEFKEGQTIPKGVLVADTIHDLPRVIRKSLRPPQ